MTALQDFLTQYPVTGKQRPWPRYQLDGETWSALRDRLQSEDWELLALWGEPACVHAVLRDPIDGSVAVVSHRCRDGGYASLGLVRPGAIRMERACADLVGLVAADSPDPRPWLDHGQWTMQHPLAAAPAGTTPGEPARAATDYRFLAVEGEGVHQVAVGPVHAGIIEPGHFRFHANGELVVRLEQRFGYTHKGIERLMQGKSVADAATLAARLSGDSTVAHSLAFARAVEAALGVRAPPRADFLRALMAELERIANHIGDFGAICNDAAFAFLQAEATTLREDVLRLSATLFGHRLMMDRVIPGGVTTDLAPDSSDMVKRFVSELGHKFNRLAAIYDNKPSLLDRTIGTGAVQGYMVHRFAAGGFIGRASGRSFDARQSPGYHPYDVLEFEVPMMAEGDVHARVWIRIREVRQSLKLIQQILARLPQGPLSVDLRGQSGEGLAIVEGFRGEIVTWVRLADDGTVARCHPRDPSWLQWPILEAAIEGNIIADFPICNKSFNCSYSGHDL